MTQSCCGGSCNRLVRRLQASGHVVGMTGDGVNDAPALREAEVGIAVASATDVAKSAAGVVLTRDGLAGIVSLIEESRRIHQRSLTYALNVSVSVLFIDAGRDVVFRRLKLRDT